MSEIAVFYGGVGLTLFFFFFIKPTVFQSDFYHFTFHLLCLRVLVSSHLLQHLVWSVFLILSIQ